MKKFKFVFWFLFIAFFALLVYQNLEFFSAKNTLHIDIGIYQKTTPEWTNGAIIAGFVGIGIFIMLLFYFASRFGVYKANKTIKEMKSAIDDRESLIAKLKDEVAMLKSETFTAHEVYEKSESDID